MKVKYIFIFIYICIVTGKIKTTFLAGYSIDTRNDSVSYPYYNVSLVFSDKGRISLKNNSTLNFIGLNMIFFDNFWKTPTIINYNSYNSLNLNVIKIYLFFILF